MADYSFARFNFEDINVHNDFLAVYKYATEKDINELCMDSPIYYPETLHPFRWEPTIAFPPGRFEIDPCSLVGITVVPPTPPTGRIQELLSEWRLLQQGSQ